MFFKNKRVIEGGSSVVTSGSTTTLLNNSSQNIRFTGTSAHTVQLPDATTCSKVTLFRIINESTQGITVNYDDASLFTTIQPGQSKLLLLFDKSTTNGTWSIFEGTGGSPYSAAARAYQVSFSIPNTSETTINPSSVDFDTAGTYNSGTGEFTVPVDDIYLVGALLYNSGTFTASTGQIEMYVNLAGTKQSYVDNSIGASTTDGCAIMTLVRATAGQKITVSAYQSNGASRNFTAEVFFIRMSAGTSTIAPTIQKFTSGSGTYNRPAGVKYIRVRAVGAGGGGGAANIPTVVAAGNGGNTTFGSSLITCNGGTAGGAAAIGGAGGSATATGLTGVVIAGGSGTGYQSPGASGAVVSGGAGGNSAFGGGGGGGQAAPGSGLAGEANTGGGGGGSGSAGNYGSGSGGGAGGYVDVIITNPASSYSYAVGTGGSAGTSGGQSGGAGGDGVIIVEEYY